MDASSDGTGSWFASTPEDHIGPEGLLFTLEQLIGIDAGDSTSALNQAAQLVAAALVADKVDIFLYHPENDSLIVQGLSDEAMSRRQLALGLNFLPVSNGGRCVWVYQTGQTYSTGHLDEDPEELLGVKAALACGR